MFLFRSTVCVRLKRKECAVKTTFYMSSGGGDILSTIKTFTQID